MKTSSDHTIRQLGARPRPVSLSDDSGGTGRLTTILGSVMVGWLFLMMALAAVGGQDGAEEPQPVTIGRGVVVSPASGWISASDVWEVGPGGMSLQKAGVVVAFAAEAYSGTADDLLQEQLAQLESELSSVRILPAVEGSVAGGAPAASIYFTGAVDGGRLEGELLAAQQGGTGVVVLAIAPLGQLRRVQSDLDSMLESLVIP